MKKNKKYKLFRNKFALVGALGILLSGCGIENNNNIKMDNDSSLTTVSEETDYTDTSIEDITTIVQETTKKEAVESTTSHSTTIEEVEATTSTSDISQLQSVELINISFDGLDTQKTLDDIKDIEVKYYFKDVFNVSDYLNKYKNLKDYNSVHSLKYINNGKIDSTTLKSKIKSNNTSYMQNNNMTNYALLNSDDFDTIFDIIVDNLNRRLEDSIDYYDLDTKLDTLKILDYSRNVNGGYTPDDNVIGINMSAMNKLNKKDFLTMVTTHESNHLVQYASKEKMEINGLEKNVGVSYSWNKKEYSTLDFQWYTEGSAEKLMNEEVSTSDGYDMYQAMVGAVDGVNLSGIYKEGADSTSFAKISLQNDLDELFKYFNCESDKDKEEIINLMATLEIINFDGDDFRERYKEVYGESFKLEYKDILKCQCYETLSKNFYYNLVNYLNKNELPLSDVFNSIYTFEALANKNVGLSRIVSDDQKDFLNTYNSAQYKCFSLIAEKLDISVDDVYMLFSDYYNKTDNKYSERLSKSQRDFLNYMKNDLSRYYPNECINDIEVSKSKTY